MAAHRVDAVARFRERVKPNGECAEWQGPVSKYGYGVATVNRKAVRAHRYAWEIASGEPIPPGHQVLHICDNRRCVRNDDRGTYEVNGASYPRFGHLFLAGQDENMADMVAKDRSPKGERNCNAKLTREQVAEIRQSYEGKRGEQRAIARRLNVTSALISQVLKGQIWEGV